MSRVRAVAFDLFGTLVWIDGMRYPRVLWEGRNRASSAPALYEALLPWKPDLAREAFYRAAITTQDDLEALRRSTNREFSSHERFRMVFERCGIDPGEQGGILLATIRRLHMDRLVTATRIFPGSLTTLAAVSRRHPVVLVSNFDDGEACRRIVRGLGIDAYLREVVVSADLGWRKPDRRVFDRAAEITCVPPDETLFVGDSPSCDVDGARGCGMRPVWIRGAELPAASWEEPEHVIQRIEEVLAIPSIC